MFTKTAILLRANGGISTSSAIARLRGGARPHLATTSVPMAPRLVKRAAAAVSASAASPPSAVSCTSSTNCIDLHDLCCYVPFDASKSSSALRYNHSRRIADAFPATTSAKQPRSRSFSANGRNFVSSAEHRRALTGGSYSHRNIESFVCATPTPSSLVCPLSEDTFSIEAAITAALNATMTARNERAFSIATFGAKRVPSGRSLTKQLAMHAKGVTLQQEKVALAIQLQERQRRSERGEADEGDFVASTSASSANTATDTVKRSTAAKRQKLTN